MTTYNAIRLGVLLGVGFAVELCVGTAVAGPSTGRPKALLALEQYRSRHFRKGEVQWSVRGVYNALDVVNFTSRFTVRSLLLVNRGDDSGTVAFDRRSARPMKGRKYYLLNQEDGAWITDGESVTIKHYPQETTAPPPDDIFHDVRAVDLSPNGKWYKSVHHALWKSGIEKHGRVTYEERIEAGLHVVTATARTADGHHTEFVWWLDPKRGWSPVKTQHRRDGELVSHTRVRVKDWNGLWFPEHLERFWRYYEKGSKPTTEITIHSVRLDDSMPDAFGPVDLGAEVGTNITVTATPSTPAHYLGWDGTKGIDPDEFSRKLAAGELKRGPNFMRAIGRTTRPSGHRTPRVPKAERAKGLFPEVLVEIVSDEWERYVRQFIERHRLSDTQTESARAVLADCRKEAEGYVAGHKKDFAALGLPSDRRRRSPKRAEQLKRLEKYYGIKPPPAGRASDPRREEARRRLYAPIDAIFEHRLKPRLEALLTAEQRAGP